VVARGMERGKCKGEPLGSPQIGRTAILVRSVRQEGTVAEVMCKGGMNSRFYGRQ
jgi:hypothetical protein